MPAAAVIPAPLAYTNVAAVKKLVVGVGANRRVVARGLWRCPPALHCCWCPTGGGSRIPTGRDRALPYPQVGWQLRVPLTGWPAAPVRFTLKKLECSRQALQACIMVHGIIE